LVDGARPDHLKKANPGGEPGNKRKKEKTMRKKLSLLACAVLVSGGIASWAQASPYATELVYASPSLSGNSLYNDPYAVLGAPATNFNSGWGGKTSRVKLVEPAYNVGLNGEKLITTLRRDQVIVVGFDNPIENDPRNPYGIDFLVFGNAMYTGSGSVSDATNMNTYMLSGGGVFNGGGWFEEALVSVSQGPEYEGQDPLEWTWYSFDEGPYGDGPYPTNSYLWDAENATWTDTLSDFTRPVNPDVFGALYGQTNVSAADAIAAYQGSGGGTGFDLDDLYELHGVQLDWIQYIKVEGTALHKEGEIDAFADVAPVPVPGAIWLLGAGVIALSGLGRRRAA
jgi:hypothetical protein